MKRRLALLLALAMILTSLFAGAADAKTVQEESSASYSGTDVKLPSQKARAEGYIRGIMRGGNATSNQPRDLGSRLTGPEKKLYDAVAAKIVQVAAGKLASTEFQIPLTSLYTKLSYTKEELGVTSLITGGQIDPTAVAKFKELTDIDTATVGRVLLQDYPYELYWFDKSPSGGWQNYSGFGTDGKTLFFDGDYYTFSMCVASEYQNGGLYTMNTSFGTAAQAAAAKAKEIITKHKGETDRTKLASYKDEICSLVSYNTAAAEGGAAYGNPWQLVWVFDGDPSTNVVCEGYAKAFQFLCDNTSFGNNISVICASGDMAGGTGSGPHMWNLVKMPDNKNYLVDVTNCDAGSVGYPDALFLKGYASGSPSAGYVYLANGNNITYVYDDSFKNLVLAEELNMSEKEYVEPPETPTPTPTPVGMTPTPTPPSQTTTPPPEGKTELPPTYQDKTGSYSISGGKASFSGPENAKAATVKIPDSITVEGKSVPVTSISAGAFSKNKKLKTVTLGKNIQVVGKNAFLNCTALTTVKGGAKVIEIGDSAFKGAKALKTLPAFAKLQTIGKNAFQGCVALKKFTLGAAVAKIGKNAFSGCKALATITVKTVKLTQKNVGAGAFKNISAKATFKCPKKKLKDYAALFVKKGAKKTCKFK